MKVLLTHPGTQYASKLAFELCSRKILLRFWTCFFIGDGSFWKWLVLLAPRRVKRRVANRYLSGIPACLIRNQVYLELQAAKQLASGMPSEQVFRKRNYLFQKAIPDTEFSKVEVVIGFDTSSWILARRCIELRKTFILDQSIAHPMQKEVVYQEIAKQYPAWSEEVVEKDPELIQSEKLEHDLASHIVVASSFTKSTLIKQGVTAEKVSIIPYGVNLHKFSVPAIDSRIARPFRFLFVGTVCARKGIPLLLEAWRRLALPDAELWLVGPVGEVAKKNIPSIPGLCVKGRMPHDDLPSIFKECDVFVFPSYFEGFGLVLLEALACGLFVITTEATAGPDILSDPDAGVVVPVGALDALENAMKQAWINRMRREDTSKAARQTAEKFSWSVYGDRWQALCKNRLSYQ